MTDCIFCRIAAGTIPADRVFEDERAVAFRDLNPQAPVHILVIPKRHIAGLDDLTDADGDTVGGLVIIARRIAHEQGLEERGWRLVVNAGPDAGQTVFHLHLHLLGGRTLGWPPG
jgi:histidine triad (HIT) family protein